MREIAKRPDIRDLILDHVDALLARNGYKKMTIDSIAHHVGIGKGTIYLHFTSKEDLTLSHIDRIAARVLERMEQIAASRNPPEERIREMLLARVLMRFDSVRGYSRSLNDLLSSLRKDLLARRLLYFENEKKAIQEVLREGRKSGAFHFRRLDETSDTLIWCTNSLLPYSLTVRELGRRKEIEARVLGISNLLLNGLCSQTGNAVGTKTSAG